MDKISHKVLDMSQVPDGDLTSGLGLDSSNNMVKGLVSVVMSEAQATAIRNANKEKYAASGFVHYGGHWESPTVFPINEGLWVDGLLANSCYLGRGVSENSFGGSKTKYPVTHIAGAVSNLLHVNLPSGSGRNNILFPDAPDGTVTYDSATGTQTQHASAAEAFASETATNKVVVRRVDMFGLEYWLEEVTNDEVFPVCIQNQSTTFGDTGVPTVLSKRPDSYFAVFDGQTDIKKGRCVLWSTLTPEQKTKVATYLGENLFVNAKGKLVNGRIRQRTIAGAGNGDWSNTSTIINKAPSFAALTYNSSRLSFVSAQGFKDTSVGLSNDRNTDGLYKGSTVSSSQGVFYADRAVDGEQLPVAYNGECYFYVIGTVPRLNQGAYHPSYNPFGTSKLINTSKNAWVNWHEATAANAASEAQCFGDYRVGDGLIDTSAPVGSIAIGLSGRPDGRYFDSIYASGLGGVIDYRLSAYDMSSPEEAAKIKAKVEDGTYRGMEKLTRSGVDGSMNSPNINTASWQYIQNGLPKPSWFPADYVDGSTLKLPRGAYFIDGTLYSGIEVAWVTDILHLRQGSNSTAPKAPSPITIVYTEVIDTSVSGKFNQVGVIGNPANILANPDLANGWLGGWIPVVDSGDVFFPLTRKSLVSSFTRAWTTNNGATWSSGPWSIDTVRNGSQGRHIDVSNVQVWPYTASAKQTKPSTNKTVLNGAAGVVSVSLLSRHTVFNGAPLVESLLGKVPTGNGSRTYQTATLVEKTLTNLGEFAYVSHEPNILSASTGVAVKVLPYQISNNGQVSLGFQANELKYKTLVVATRTEHQMVNVPKGEVYKVKDGTRFINRFLRSNKSSGVPLSNANWLLNSEGILQYGGASGLDGSHYFNEITNLEQMWGDDSTMKIANGSTTFTDLNGQTCLAVSHELAIPYGYSKNYARAGTQVAGVDRGFKLWVTHVESPLIQEVNARTPSFMI